MADNPAQERLTAPMHLLLVTPPPPKPDPEVKATGSAVAKLLRLQ